MSYVPYRPPQPQWHTPNQRAAYSLPITLQTLPTMFPQTFNFTAPHDTPIGCLQLIDQLHVSGVRLPVYWVMMHDVYLSDEVFNSRDADETRVSVLDLEKVLISDTEHVRLTIRGISEAEWNKIAREGGLAPGERRGVVGVEKK